MIEEIKINNYKIILNHVKTSMITRVDAYINNGFINEDMNNAGISHLLEHILTDSFKACNNNCSEYWKKKGIITNAMTTETYINYYVEGLKEYSMDMLRYILNICTKPVINKTILNKEKKAVINELLIHDTHPQIDLMQQLNKTFYRVPGLQYQDDNKLQIKNLSKITVKHVKDWFNQYYTKNNIIFIIQGNFNKQRTLQLLRKKLKRINSPITSPKYLEIFNQGKQILYVKNTNMDNTCINIAFSSSVYQRDKESRLIHLFTNFINSNVTSMLMDTLREKKKLIYSVSVDTITNPYGSSLFIEIFTKNNNIKKVILNTIKILKKLVNGKFTTEYLNYVKKAYMTEYFATCTNFNYLSTFYGEQYINQIMNVSDNPIILSRNEVLTIIKNINKRNFILFLKKYLIFQNMKIIYQGKQHVANLHNHPLLVPNKM